MIVWFIGMSGAGKTTLTNKLDKTLTATNVPHVVFDGDEVRKYINKDCGFSAEDRLNNVRRVMNICKFTHDYKIFTVVNNIMPYRKLRLEAKGMHGPALMIVYVKCDMETLMDRDTKGLYDKASKGEIKLTGYNADWDEPCDDEVDLVLDTGKMSERECFDLLLEGIVKHRNKKLEDYGI